MAEFNSVKDSGHRRQFVTGAVRDRAFGKGRYDLITPLGLRRIAKHYENGAVKYKDRNWELGMPVKEYVDSAIRHLFTYLAGDMSEDHLAAAGWNVLGAIHTEEMVEMGRYPKDFAMQKMFLPLTEAELKAQLAEEKKAKRRAKKNGKRKTKK